MNWSENFESIVLVVIGLLGMPLTAYLKSKLNWSDLYALLLTGAVAFGLAALNLFLAGDLTVEMFTLQNFAEVFGMIFTAATVWYRLLKEGRKE